MTTRRARALCLAGLLVAVAACGSGDDADSTSSDTSSPSTPSLDTSSPDTSSPDTSSPDTSSLNTSSPDTFSPDTSSPSTSPVDTSRTSPVGGGSTPTTSTERTAAAPTTDGSTTSSAEVGGDDESSTVVCSPRGPRQHTFTLDAGGAAHEVRVYVPTSFDGSGLLPLVLNWHGLGSNGREQALLTGYEELAETEGFAVAHPTGVPFDGTDSNSWEFGAFEDPSRDDVAFADELIDLLVADYCVDELRVYSTGMSNGGLFTSHLVCELADRLAAAASVAGLSHADGCMPSRAVPFMAMHGTADLVVPFDGTETDSVLAASGANSAFFDQIIPDEFAEFAADMGCSPAPLVESRSPDVIARTYRGCDDGVPLVFYEITDGGHTWPNTPIIDRIPPVIGYTTTEVDATVDAWTFFEQHVLPR